VQQDKALLRAFRDQAKAIQTGALERAKKDLAQGSDPERVLERLSNDLTNKLIHAPTMAIRNASGEGRTDLLEYLRELYDINEQQDSDPAPDQEH